LSGGRWAAAVEASSAKSANRASKADRESELKKPAGRDRELMRELMVSEWIAN